MYLGVFFGGGGGALFLVVVNIWIYLFIRFFFFNLSFFMTTLGKISGAATKYIIIIWLSQYQLNPNFRALELGV